jgi:NAD(P)-dependent dehydrogenase (short-subunit alcohol dehydrogenase family)
MEVMIATICTTYPPLHHAFNNVGFMQSAQLGTMTREVWDWTLEGSLTSTFLAMKHELPIMRRNGGGTIVNRASIAGKLIDGNSPAYAAAKAGVVQLTRHASCIAAQRNIGINSVSPGMLETSAIAPMFPPARKATYLAARQANERTVKPEEIAATCCCFPAMRRQ